MSGSLDALLRGTADGAFVTDEEGRVVLWNAAAEQVFGYPAARVLGKPCHEVLCGRDIYGNRYCDENCALMKMVRRREQIRRFHVHLRVASGEYRLFEVSALYQRGPRPNQYAVLHVVRPAESAVAAAVPQPSPAVPEPPPAVAARSANLSWREIEVLRLIAEGAPTREIADRLFISVATVRTHVQNILKKLEVHSKAEAVAVAFRLRLI